MSSRMVKIQKPCRIFYIFMWTSRVTVFRDVIVWDRHSQVTQFLETYFEAKYLHSIVFFALTSFRSNKLPLSDTLFLPCFFQRIASVLPVRGVDNNLISFAIFDMWTKEIKSRQCEFPLKMELFLFRKWIKVCDTNLHSFGVYRCIMSVCAKRVLKYSIFCEKIENSFQWAALSTMNETGFVSSCVFDPNDWNNYDRGKNWCRGYWFKVQQKTTGEFAVKLEFWENCDNIL